MRSGGLRIGSYSVLALIRVEISQNNNSMVEEVISMLATTILIVKYSSKLYDISRAITYHQECEASTFQIVVPANHIQTSSF